MIGIPCAAASLFQRVRGGLITLTLGLCLLFSSELGWATPAIAQPVTASSQTEQSQLANTETSFATPSGSQLFTDNCAACHAGGGNLIRRGKTLKQKALKRYGYQEASAIVSLVTVGKGAMPAFEDRLSVTEISAIAQYVQTQAATGWK